MISAHSKKEIVLDALHRNGMAPDVRTLVVWTKGIDHGMNIKTMTRTLWDLQKQQLVGFAERHGELFKIRMTDVAAATFYNREKRKKQPVERVVEARKPRIIKGPEYRVPEPPRYASPAPPAQNLKSFTDEQKGSANTSARHAEDMRDTSGKDAVVDTHTQYRYNPTEQHNIYPDRLKTRAGVISMRSAARMLVGLDQMGGEGHPTKVAALVGINTNSRPSIFKKVLLHWGWVEEADNNILKITPDGYQALAAYRADEDPNNWELTPDKKTAIRKTQPLPVVARDVADAEKKDPVAERIGRSTSMGDEMLRNMVPETPLDKLAAPDLDDYPLIKDLMGKEERLVKYQRAADLLGDDDATTDIVLALLDKIQITDLEREVIRFVRNTQL